METTSSPFCDVLNIVPDEFELLIAAPSLTDETMLELLTGDIEDYTGSIRMNATLKVFLIEYLGKHPVEEEFHEVQIRTDHQRWFQGYDGMSSCFLSKQLIIPHWFFEKYIESGWFGIATEW